MNWVQIQPDRIYYRSKVTAPMRGLRAGTFYVARVYEAKRNWLEIIYDKLRKNVSYQYKVVVLRSKGHRRDAYYFMDDTDLNSTFERVLYKNGRMVNIIK